MFVEFAGQRIWEVRLFNVTHFTDGVSTNCHIIFPDIRIPLTQVQLGSGDEAASNTMTAARNRVPVLVMVDGHIKKQQCNVDLQAKHAYVTNMS